ncbi:glycosyltransferase family 2 protein [Streptacidiphilus melanogenes]|uniref:glycosyltransferase family 2 protein n=1 Tax=Streptacidiphilus melanogenes TaxID=411235 RepID=UPI0007C64878|nr:glycosyltransferase [Streptacidiphilus melanogenes]
MRPACGADPAAAPTLSVVICCYTTDRWDDVRAAVASVAAQRPPVLETVVVVDHCPALERLVREQLADGTRVRAVANAERRGLSGARNTGVAEAHGEVVAFLDDDAAAEPGWAAAILAGYARGAGVLGVGGAVLARWEGERPHWFPPEFDWVVGCSYRGGPETATAVRNFIGANMSFRRAALQAAGGFRTDLGRVGTRPLGCEETELCLRLTASRRDAELLHRPDAVVRHHVPPQRGTWRYFLTRCYGEGLSKAAVTARTGASRALASERAYLRRTVPLAVTAALRPGRQWAPRRALALGAGVSLTVLGYAAGTLHRLHRPAPPASWVTRLRALLARRALGLATEPPATAPAESGLPVGVVAVPVLLSARPAPRRRTGGGT